jgi:hypothetical protein
VPCLNDEPKDVVKNWMRSKDSIEFLGLWEQLHNDKFKGVEFDSFRKQAGLNAFTLSPQVLERLKILGLRDKMLTHINSTAIVNLSY